MNGIIARGQMHYEAPDGTRVTITGDTYSDGTMVARKEDGNKTDVLRTQSDAAFSVRITTWHDGLAAAGYRVVGTT